MLHFYNIFQYIYINRQYIYHLDYLFVINNIDPNIKK